MPRSGLLEALAGSRKITTAIGCIALVVALVSALISAREPHRGHLLLGVATGAALFCCVALLIQTICARDALLRRLDALISLAQSQLPADVRQGRIAVDKLPPESSLSQLVGCVGNLARDHARHLAEVEHLASTREVAVREAQQAAQTTVAIAEALGAMLDQADDVRADKPWATAHETLRGRFNSRGPALRFAPQTLAAPVSGLRRSTDTASAAADALTASQATGTADLETCTAQLIDIGEGVARSVAETRIATDAITHTAHAATQSNEIVAKAIDAMHAIESSASRIGEIIGVIDEIAFQTSLLALNAGVEAARAGDAGRGFAVVATEVRALAARSADAAKQIKAIINESSHHVEQGVGLVGDAGTALHQIAQQIKSAAATMTSLATTASGQSSALKDVGQKIAGICRGGGRTSAQIGRTAAAISDMQHDLADLILEVTALGVDESDLTVPATRGLPPGFAVHADRGQAADREIMLGSGRSAPVSAKSPAAVSAPLQRDDNDWEEF